MARLRHRLSSTLIIFTVTGDSMVGNVVMMIDIEVQDESLRSVCRNEPPTIFGNELIWPFEEAGGEGVDPEHDGSEVLDHWVITENANICSGSES